VRQNITIAVPPGVVQSGTPSTNPGRWYASNMVRWHENHVQPIGGWERATSSPLPSKARAILTALDNGYIRRSFYLCDNHFVVEEGGTFFNRTPVGYIGAQDLAGGGGYGEWTYGSEDYGDVRENGNNAQARPPTFSLASWGEDVLTVASSDGRLRHWDATAPTTAPPVVAGAPTGIVSMVVTDERHVMLGGYDGFNTRIAWSSREDFNDWDFANPLNTAGFIDLSGAGQIVAMRKVRDGILVWTDADVWLVRFIGFPFIYSVQRVGENCAPVSPQSIAVYDARAAWLGREGFWRYDGGRVDYLRCDIADFVFEGMDREFARFRATASANGVFPEVWFFFPSDGQDENDRVAIWNFAENWWAPSFIPRTAMAPAGTIQWPVAANPDGDVYLHERGWSAAGVDRCHCEYGGIYVETDAISLGNGDAVMSVSAAQPDSFRGADKTKFTFFTRYTKEGAEVTHGPFTARDDGYMDLRLQGRDIRLRVNATEDGLWTVGSLRLKVAPRGKR
jgi:hypothetical protein